MFLEVVLSIFLVIILKAVYAVKWMSGKKQTYSKPGHLFAIKKCIAYVFFRAVQSWRRRNREQTHFRGDSYWQSMDRVQPLLQHAYAADCVQFTAMAESGKGVSEDTLVMLKLTMRPDNVAELCLYLQVPGHGFLQHPSHPDTIITCRSYDSQTNTYAADGVLIEIKEPGRQWRISYHGLMRMANTMKEPSRWCDGKNLVYVKFGFTWTSYSACYDLTNNIDPHILSEATARESWSYNFFHKLQTFRLTHTNYEQWGQLRGTLYVDGMEEGPMGRELTLRGPRSHSFGLINYSAYHRYIRVHAHTRNGLTISLTAVCISDILTHVTSGYVVLPNRTLETITWTDLSLRRHGENGCLPNLIQFNLATATQKCNVVCLVGLSPEINNGSEWEGRTHNCLADVYVNSVQGRGTVEFYYRTPSIVCPIERTKKPSPFAFKFPSTDSTKLALCLNEESCQNPQFVGESGSQLAKIKSITHNHNLSQFYVMDGFCVSAHAFCLHVEGNSEVKELLETMQVVLRSNNSENLRNICNRCYSAFINSTFSGSLASELASKFNNLSNISRRMALKLVVSSSLVGESSLCGDESQKTSYSDLTNLSQVMKSILKCWANQCAYEAVQFRRQNCYPALPAVPVLVHAMVEDPRASGVITTCDPNSGDPTVLYLDANYVVKKVTAVDQSQPDRMVLRRSDDGSFRIVSQSIGLKQKITKNGQSGQATPSDLSVEYVHECCLSYDNVQRLGQLALDLKSAFRQDREMCWTTTPGKIYLTRVCRMSADYTESEYESLHEFDSAYSLDATRTSTEQIGDVLPEISTPLTISTVVWSTALSLKDVDCIGNSSESEGMVASVACGRSMINVHDMLPPSNISSFLGIDTTGLISKLNEEQITDYHGTSLSILQRLQNKLSYVFKTKSSKKHPHLFMNKITTLKPTEIASARGEYSSIADSILPCLRDVTRCYVIACRKFYLLEEVLKVVLSGHRKPAMTPALSQDLGMILCAPDGNAPVTIANYIQSLSEAIVDAGFKEEFVAMKPLKAVKWLNSNDCGKKVSDLYGDFMENHGHRCLAELELREQSWQQDQTKVVTALQATVECQSERRSNIKVNVDSLIDKLNSSVNSFQRFLLRSIIPWTQNAVREMDWSKSQQIKIVDALKKSYWTLAKMLRTENLLPDEDLLFFLTHTEVGKMVKSAIPLPKLVARSIKRRHIHSRQKNLTLSPTSDRIPQEPITEFSTNANESIAFNTVLQGVAVSGAKVRAPVRIVSDLSEAFLIQAGEILITEKPDIGWSVYYPLVVGLVTECGRMSSQGALAAGRYGLPCVVGISNATKCFKTGDVVIMDGTNGTLQRAVGGLAAGDTTSLHA